LTAQEALAEMRLLIFELRPPILQQEGLLAALQARLQAVEGRANLKTDIKTNFAARLPPDIEEGLYHIAREALNNAIKHAHAHMITVRLYRAEHRMILEIADDGVGFAVAPAREMGGLGLRVMEERAAELGGSLRLASEPGRGTRVVVEVPI
jgi:signal transduction histidine kinase